MSDKGSIFISYRRSDSIAETGRIYDRLVTEFGREHVFKDVDNIPLGSDFAEVLDKALSQCQVLLVIIGKSWVTVTEPDGTKRLDNPDDFVRIEVELALQSNIPVIPVLMEGVTMPKRSQLPESLHKLARRNGIQIGHDPRFHQDMNRLVKALNNLLVKEGSTSQPPSPLRQIATPSHEAQVRKPNAQSTVEKSLNTIDLGNDVRSKCQIFLAHASEDKAEVIELYNRLKARGYKPWLDQEDLIPGTKWKEEIPKAIKNSDICIACLSSTSVNKKGYVQREFRLALNQYAERPYDNIYLIPLRLDECTIPDLRQEDYGIAFRDFQWFDYWKPDGFEKLLKALDYQFENLYFPPTVPPNTLKTLSVISPDKISRLQGFSYQVYASDLPALTDIPADSLSSPDASPLVLLENGIPFGQAHSQHKDIFEIGAGTYSHWDGGDDSVPHRIYLLFSTPSNLDPRTNDKEYKIAAPRNVLPGGRHGSKIKIFDNTNIEAVQNGGISPLFNVPFGKAYHLLSIHTYHWNNGQGQIPGTLGIEDEAGNRKEWQATATSGYKGAPNVNWSVDVDERIILRDINGPYKVLDSDPKTWSQNSSTQGKGFAIIWLRLLSGY